MDFLFEEKEQIAPKMTITRLSRCGKVTKIVFVILNIVYLVLSVVLFGVGIYILYDGVQYQALSSLIVVAPGALMVVGGIAGVILVVGGFIAAFGQLRGFLLLYAVMCSLLVLYTLIFGVYGVVYPSFLVSALINKLVIGAVCSTKFPRSLTSTALDRVQNLCPVKKRCTVWKVCNS
jgi:hypothetical protein